MWNSFSFPENNGAPLNHWLSFRHLLLTVWPNPIVEIQAVNSPWPSNWYPCQLREWIWSHCLKLYTVLWSNSSIKKPEHQKNFRKNLLVQNGQFYLLDNSTLIPHYSYINPYLTKVVPNWDLRPKQKPLFSSPHDKDFKDFLLEFLVWYKLSVLTDKWHFYTSSAIVLWVCRALGISEDLLWMWLVRQNSGVLVRHLTCHHSINMPLQPYLAFKIIVQKNVAFRCLSQKSFRKVKKF